jgi:hypothetical protein
MTDDDLYSTAIHESGHAVLSELFDLNTEYVTIEPTDKTYGHLRQRIRAYGPHGRWRDLLVIAGGCVAQEFDVLDPSEYLEWPDTEDEATDSARLWASLQEHSEDEDQRQAWFELALAQTQRILRQRPVWRSVQSLAAALLEKRTLDRWETAGVIEAALGRSKWSYGVGRIQMGFRYAPPPLTWIDSREEYRETAALLAAHAAGGAK